MTGLLSLYNQITLLSLIPVSESRSEKHISPGRLLPRHSHSPEHKHHHIKVHSVKRRTDVSMGDKGSQENERYAPFKLGNHLEIDYKIDCLSLVSDIKA